MTIEQLLQNLLSASPLLMALAPFWYILKKNITEDLVSKDDLENIVDRLRRDIEKEQKDDKNYLHTLDKRTQDNAKLISEIKGRLDK